MTITNGLSTTDLDRLRIIATRRGGSPDGQTIRIGFLGRLSPEKGTRELASLAHALSSHGGFRLDIGGDGAERARLLDATGDLLRSGFAAWHGTIRDPIEFLEDVDILVLPSHNEGLPYALLEGMAAGCAVVAYAVGGIPEVIREPSLGILVEPGDEDRFVEAVIELAGDQDRRQVMGAAASAHIAAEYSLDSRMAALRKTWGLDGTET